MATIKLIMSWMLTIFLIIGTVALSFAEDVNFQGTTKMKDGNFVMLKGKLTIPQGNGPFPAVVLIHGCRGIDKAQDAWAERFANWGYAAFQIDSFAPRGAKNVCETPFMIPFTTRVQDAYDAKAYLGGLPFIKRDQIAVAGWSHGGAITIASVNPGSYLVWATLNGRFSAQQPAPPFRAAVAFYPYVCVAPLNDSGAPLLILVGDSDVVAPVTSFKRNMPQEKTAHETILKVYNGAYHTFDAEGVDNKVPNSPVWFKYDSAAAADAIVQVKDFLTRHFK